MKFSDFQIPVLANKIAMIPKLYNAIAQPAEKIFGCRCICVGEGVTIVIA